MLRLVFAFLALFIEASDVFSQTEEKAILVGIHNSFIINNNSISFSLSPQIGYFLKKKILLGLSTPPSSSSKSLKGIYVPNDGFVKNRGLVILIQI